VSSPPRYAREYGVYPRSKQLGETMKFRAVLVVAAGLLTLSACGSSGDETSSSTEPRAATTVESSSSESKATTAATEVETTKADTTAVATTKVATTAAATTAVPGGKDSLTVESGFSTAANSGSQQTSSGAVVTNGGGKSACGVQVQFNLLDAAGTTIDTGTETIEIIPAGATAIVAPTILGFNKGVPASLNVAVVKVDDFVGGTTLNDCDGFTILKGIPVEVVSPTIDRAQFASGIKGQLMNSSTDLVETAYIDCVYRAGGVVVGGESTASLDPIPPGGSVAFSAGLGLVPDTADAVECQAMA
jgi:hypothetical protein